MTEPLTVGGLFSGIGGWELGLERAGMEIAWHCEADPFCQRVLEKHWPGVPTFEDVCTLNAGMAEGVDPCQDISLAGKGAGIDGARSGLWSEFARLIGEFRPRYVCVENVSALLGRGLDRVLGDLSALGFDAEWDCIPASAVGAPHQRDRVWLIAYPSRDDGGQGRTRRPDPSGEGQREPVRSLPHSDADSGRFQVGSELDSDPSQDSAYRDSRRGHADGLRNEMADAAHKRYERTGSARQGRLGLADSRSGGSSGWWAVEPDVGRVANGVPQRVDRLRSLGNALVPQIAEWIGRRIVAYEDSLDAQG